MVILIEYSFNKESEIEYLNSAEGRADERFIFWQFPISFG